MQKATLGGSIEFTTAPGSIVVLIFFFFPLPSLLLGISFQKKALEVSVSKKGFLLVSVSSYRTDGAHTALLAPPRSRNTSVHHCLPAVLQSHPDPSVQESVMQTFPFPPGRMV